MGVAHSAGSMLAQGITTQDPEDFDAVILSGTSAGAASVPLTMAPSTSTTQIQTPHPKFQHLPVGFLTHQSAAGIQVAFY